MRREQWNQAIGQAAFTVHSWNNWGRHKKQTLKLYVKTVPIILSSYTCDPLQCNVSGACRVAVGRDEQDLRLNSALPALAGYHSEI